MADYDITEIADARHTGLMCPPASPEARALVNDIIFVCNSGQRIAMETFKDQFFRRNNIEPRLKVK